MRWHQTAVLALLIVTATMRVADAIPDVDRNAGRTLIEKQIDAFRRDDATGAFDLASPSIQQMFRSPEIFIDMVRQGYRAVYRPRSFEFGETRDMAEGFEQLLRIQDSEGVEWDAVYSFERQPDGSWKIAGCRLVKRPGDSA